MVMRLPETCSMWREVPEIIYLPAAAGILPPKESHHLVFWTFGHSKLLLLSYTDIGVLRFIQYTWEVL